MSESTIRKLVEARLRVVNEVNSGKLSVSSGAKILGITRQGLWKLRRSVEKYGSQELLLAGNGAPRGIKEPTTGPKGGSKIQLRNISIYMGLGPTGYAGYSRMPISTYQEQQPTGS